MLSHPGKTLNVNSSILKGIAKEFILQAYLHVANFLADGEDT